MRCWLAAAVLLMLVACDDRDPAPSDDLGQQDGTVAQTCQQAGGTCAPLSDAGYGCTNGAVPSPGAGSCAAGSSCCLPAAKQLTECPTKTRVDDAGLSLLIELKDGDPCDDAGLACFRGGSASGWGFVFACYCVEGKVSCNELDISDGAPCTLVPEGTSVFNTCPCASEPGGGCDGQSTCVSGTWQCNAYQWFDAGAPNPAPVDAGVPDAPGATTDASAAP